MTDSKLHSLTAASSLADTDEFYAVVSPFSTGTDRRVTLSTLRTYLLKSQAAFTIQVNTIGNTPADSTTYYFGGSFGTTAGTIAGNRRIYIPANCKITGAYFVFSQNAGSAETSSLYIRVNDTTDYLVSSSVVNNATTAVASNTSLSISLSAGSYIEMKWITPAWATNPTLVSISGILYAVFQ